ncbi:hypothetical protein FANTH_13142 [Fusarium anthophilum]|uniref:homogentisate 1,2-dioxygenase n=1 Tax=Fusarium anthophilum TaxID=48485 RepID=A0A8H5DQN9_9HYPO|nr:hypothetical protein FANTH_13142 [Fusarium anthophilum]
MPPSVFKQNDPYQYLTGFGNYHESQAIKNTIPVAQNSPQRLPYGLYTEKLSGTAFTVPRVENQHSWLYRILPTASHDRWEELSQLAVGSGISASHENSTRTHQELKFTPDQLLFEPFDIQDSHDWVSGSRHLAGAGDPMMKTGIAIYVFTAGKDMPPKQAYYSSDGDLLIVLQYGVMDVQTELGRLLIRPNEILVIPRGIRYRVTLPEGPIRGYSLELFQGHFKLPELGVIGSSGLANARDFQIPTANYEQDTISRWSIISRFNGKLWQLHQDHSPFDVVAWHGMYYPYKYDLGRFNSINSVSYDHIDPSIYTVLTAPSPYPGVAVVDFAFFPKRWTVQEDTFRPPWYHRNTMAEFSAMISASVDMSRSTGLRPGGAQLHNIMSGHGPDVRVFEKASNEALVPRKDGHDVQVFMFETSLMLGTTEWGLVESKKVRESYRAEKWQPLKVNFQPPEDA